MIRTIKESAESYHAKEIFFTIVIINDIFCDTYPFSCHGDMCFLYRVCGGLARTAKCRLSPDSVRCNQKSKFLEEFFEFTIYNFLKHLIY